MHSRSAPRRRHSAELRAQVLAQCDAPGASVAAVAQAHGLNANLVHKWRGQSRSAKSATRMPSADIGHKSAGAVGSFVALQLPAVRAPAAPADIRIEVRRGATTVNIAWPTDAAGDCTAWLREWLR
jgi:transposase